VGGIVHTCATGFKREYPAVPAIMPAARISSCAGVDHVAHRRAAEFVPEHAHEPGLSERRVPRLPEIATALPGAVRPAAMGRAIRHDPAGLPLYRPDALDLLGELRA